MKQNILTQEQIAQMFDEGTIDYNTHPDLVIYDFLFEDSSEFYERHLNLLFTEYFKHVDYSHKDNESVLQTFQFFSSLCKKRDVLIQIATDKGIINPKN